MNIDNVKMLTKINLTSEQLSKHLLAGPNSQQLWVYEFGTLYCRGYHFYGKVWHEGGGLKKISILGFAILNDPLRAQSTFEPVMHSLGI